MYAIRSYYAERSAPARPRVPVRMPLRDRSSDPSSSPSTLLSFFAGSPERTHSVNIISKFEILLQSVLGRLGRPVGELREDASFGSSQTNHRGADPKSYNFV